MQWWFDVDDPVRSGRPDDDRRTRFSGIVAWLANLSGHKPRARVRRGAHARSAPNAPQFLAAGAKRDAPPRRADDCPFPRKPDFDARDWRLLP